MFGYIPVVKVHHSLDCIPSTCSDVALEARKQRSDHVHAVLLTLPEKQAFDLNSDHLLDAR